MQSVSLQLAPQAASPGVGESRLPAARPAKGAAEPRDFLRPDASPAPREPAGSKGPDPQDGPSSDGKEPRQTAPAAKEADRASKEVSGQASKDKAAPEAQADGPAGAFSLVLLRLAGVTTGEKGAAKAASGSGGSSSGKKSAAPGHAAAQAVSARQTGQGVAKGRSAGGTAAHPQSAEKTAVRGEIAPQAGGKKPSAVASPAPDGKAVQATAQDAPAAAKRGPVARFVQEQPASDAVARPAAGDVPASEARRPSGRTAREPKTAAAAKLPRSEPALAAKKASLGPKPAASTGNEAPAGPTGRGAGGFTVTVDRTGGEATVTHWTGGESPSGLSPTASAPTASASRPAGPAWQAGQADMPAGPRTPSVGDQIVETVRASGSVDGRRIVVRLHPPELGRVRITLRREGDDVTGTIRVENEATLGRLAREASDLMGRLQEAGTHLRRLDVALDEPASGQGQPGADSRAGGGEADGSQAGDGAPAGADEPAPQAVQTAETDEAPVLETTETAIDVRI